jgi:hypothetical protein
VTVFAWVVIGLWALTLIAAGRGDVEGSRLDRAADGAETLVFCAALAGLGLAIWTVVA